MNVNAIEVLRPIRILVAEDENSLRSLLVYYLQNLGQQTIEAVNGKEAVEKFIEEAPDLVIMDVMMPEMDGYEATRKIKEIAGRNWVPVIFTSALTTSDEQVKGIEAGGDDYLIKPYSYTVLAAKIRAMQRIALMQKTLAESLAKLEDYKEKTEQELALAHYIMGQLTHENDLPGAGVSLYSRAAGVFSGDMVAAVVHEERKYVLLADVTGHGLSSALNSIPLVDVFYEAAAKCSRPEDVCRYINRKLKRIMPGGYFVAAVLAVIDSKQKTVSVWNGALPEASYVDIYGQEKFLWPSRHLALGILSDEDFEDDMETYHWAGAGSFVAYTDGVSEARNDEGMEFGINGVKKSCQKSADLDIAKVVGQELENFVDATALLDDVTVVSVRCE